jgi:[FeFe] hydrogenase H-cluster maturation GTPase HydF
MQPAPKNQRLHIGIFGRRNVGKSSLLNALVNQQVAIVSPIAGTTTDPVEKPMELLPLGPVVFIDTAGIDDDSLLGAQRVERTRQAFDRTDLAIIVTVAAQWGEFESSLVAEFERRSIPIVVVANKCDIADAASDARVNGIYNTVRTSALTNAGIAALRQALIAAAPDSFVNAPAIVADLVAPGSCVVLVVPIDKEAPRGRLILPGPDHPRPARQRCVLPCCQGTRAA